MILEVSGPGWSWRCYYPPRLLGQHSHEGGIQLLYYRHGVGHPADKDVTFRNLNLLLSPWVRPLAKDTGSSALVERHQKEELVSSHVPSCWNRDEIVASLHSSLFLRSKFPEWFQLLWWCFWQSCRFLTSAIADFTRFFGLLNPSMLVIVGFFICSPSRFKHFPLYLRIVVILSDIVDLLLVWCVAVELPTHPN